MYTYEYSEGTHISLHFKNNVHLKKKKCFERKSKNKKIREEMNLTKYCFFYLHINLFFYQLQCK